MPQPILLASYASCCLVRMMSHTRAVPRRTHAPPDRPASAAGTLLAGREEVGRGHQREAQSDTGHHAGSGLVAGGKGRLRDHCTPHCASAAGRTARLRTAADNRGRHSRRLESTHATDGRAAAAVLGQAKLGERTPHCLEDSLSRVVGP